MGQRAWRRGSRGGVRWTGVDYVVAARCIEESKIENEEDELDEGIG